MKFLTRGLSLSIFLLSLVSIETRAQVLPGLNDLRNNPNAPSAPASPTPPSTTPPVAPLPRTTPPPVSPAPTTATPPPVSTPPNQPPASTNGAPKPSANTVAPVLSDDGIYLNAVDTDIREIIKLISKATGKNFLVDQKIRGKVTIVSEKKMTIEEAYQAFLSSLEVLGYTVVQAPGSLIKIVPMKGALQQPLPIYDSDSPKTDAYITRLIQLSNISALEMSNAIKDLVSKDGNLFAYPATNTLIVTDSGSNIDRLLRIIRELDQEGPSESIQIIPLRNANAKDVAAKITQLYEQDAGATGSTRNAPRTAAARPRAGIELSETPYLSKVIPDERTNSIIVLASKRALVKVRELVARLDQKLDLGAEGKIHVHYLKHADAKDLSTVLSALTTGIVPQSQATAGGVPGSTAPIPGSLRQGRTGTGAAGAMPLVAEFEGGIKVAADENTNALIVTATAKDYKTLATEVIDKLDIPRKQVYVEVIIMELTLSKNRDIGVSGQGGAGIGNDLVAFATSLGGTSAGLASALSGAFAAGVVSQNTFTIPFVNPETGTSANVEVPTFGAILHALDQDGTVNVLSTPNLLTLDNEEAEIIVGSEQPFPAGTTLTPGGNSTFNVIRENVGITLKMTPQINEGDTVKIKLRQEVSKVVPTPESLLTTIGPATTKRSVETVVAAKDQQTIVIGGLIDDALTVNTNKVPFLGDIPILGHLFKRKTTIKEKTNLLVFLRPYIIRDTKDFVKVLQKKVEERNIFLDQNYGRRQRENIRSSIRTHSADLLEFKKDIQRQDWNFQDAKTTKIAPISAPEQPVPPGAYPTEQPIDLKTKGTERHRNELLEAGRDAGVQ